MERLNVRYLADDALGEPCGLVTVDVSFISLTLVVPPLVAHLLPGGHLLTLVKPQFEVGRGQVGKGGIVRDERLRRDVIDRRAAELAALGLRCRGTFDSPVAGVGGNREAFALFHQAGGDDGS